jgi:hypothetical protein
MLTCRTRKGETEPQVGSKAVHLRDFAERENDGALQQERNHSFRARDSLSALAVQSSDAVRFDIEEQLDLLPNDDLGLQGSRDLSKRSANSVVTSFPLSFITV